MLAPPAERIDVLIAQLDADAFKVREEAYQELRKLGKLAERQIRQALAKKPGLDVQLPLGRLVEELEITSFGVPPGDCLRGIRAVRVLAALDTPEARQHLERLAQGAKAAILTQRAQAAPDACRGRKYRERRSFHPSRLGGASWSTGFSRSSEDRLKPGLQLAPPESEGRKKAM